MFLKEKTSVFYCFSVLCLLTAACASSKKKISFSKKEMNQMDQALSLMQNKEFLNSAKIYDELSQNLKNSKARSLMLFNAGSAYKEAGLCKKALIRYRRLLDRSLKDPSFKARALMEISCIYECLGDAELAFLSLEDAKTSRSFLPWSLNQIVYPARLAIAHARMGQISEAEHHKSLSLTNILQSRTAFSSEKELNERAARMFYLMGRSYIQKKHLKPEVFFKAFPYHQLFLLQSLFLKEKIWSKLAEEELNLLFDKLLFAVQNTKDKQKYKKLLTKTIKDARILIKKEKSKKLESFYSKRTRQILNLLSKPS